MKDTVHISVDDRRFSIWEWIVFLTASAFFTFHSLAFCGGGILLTWGPILQRDFTHADLIWAVGLTIVFGPLLVALYSFLFLDGIVAGFSRSSVFLDSRAARVILQSRHITGIRRQKSYDLAEHQDFKVIHDDGEEGRQVRQIELTLIGRPVRIDITNPRDAAELPAVAARFGEAWKRRAHADWGLEP